MIGGEEEEKEEVE